MATTIQVADDTKQLLDMLKEESGADSFDTMLKTIVKEKLALPASMFGAGKAKGIRWKKEYRADFHEHEIPR